MCKGIRKQGAERCFNYLRLEGMKWKARAALDSWACDLGSERPCTCHHEMLKNLSLSLWLVNEDWWDNGACIWTYEICVICMSLPVSCCLIAMQCLQCSLNGFHDTRTLCLGPCIQKGFTLGLMFCGLLEILHNFIFEQCTHFESHWTFMLLSRKRLLKKNLFWDSLLLDNFKKLKLTLWSQ